MNASGGGSKKLGEILIERGSVDSAALFRALRQQRAQGGRLGTNLLDLRLVGEDDLLAALSRETGLPPVTGDELRSIDAGVLRVVPAKVAQARKAIPFRASASQVSVAVLDQRDRAAMDELAFVTGRRVRPYVALELRIQEALSRHYHVEIPGRFVKVLDRINREKYLWEESSSEGPASAPTADVSSAPPAPALRGLPESGGAAAPVPVAAAAVEPAPAAPQLLSPIEFEEAEAALLEPGDRDDVARTLLRFANGKVSAALLLMVRREACSPWMVGAGLDPERFASLEVPLDQPSFVVSLRGGASHVRGPLAPLRGEEGLASLLGDLARFELFALPLRVRGRLVGVLVVTGERAPLGARLVDQLQRLVAKGSVALEMLVLRQKLRRT